MRAEQGLYEFEKHDSKLDRIRITKDHKVLGVMLIKPHQFGDVAFKTIEIVLLKLAMSKVDSMKKESRHELFQTKVVFNVETFVPYIDFEFSDELLSF